MSASVSPDLIEAYRRDGVVFLPQVLEPKWLDLIAAGIRRNLANPSPEATRYFEGKPGEFYEDRCSYGKVPEYRELLRDSPLADIVRALMETEKVWLFYDQIFIKEGGWSRRTPWHQDMPYFLAEGRQMASTWISLDPLTKEESLEVIPGSHLGPMYNGANFDGESENTPFNEVVEMPPLPLIEAEREKWPIVSWPVTPGDVLILHPGVLHGGAPMKEGGRRWTTSIRFYGDDVRYVERPGQHAPLFPGVPESHADGDLLRHSWFPLLRGAA